MQWRGASPKLEETPAGSLAERLEKITRDTVALVPAERLQPPLREIERLQAEELAGRALHIGDRAPDFELPDHSGKSLRSGDLLVRGPLVVSFFRGRWDPYCMTELAAWKAAWPQLQEAGASLVAISPQTPKHANLVFQQHVTPFPILSDAGNAVARRFGIVYRVSDEMRAHFQSILINLKPYNGDDSWELPLPATFAIVPEGVIVYAHADEDPRRRAEPADVISVLRQLASPPHSA